MIYLNQLMESSNKDISLIAKYLYDNESVDYGLTGEQVDDLILMLMNVESETVNIEEVFADGYAEGYDFGTGDGYDRGFDDGYDTGYEEGLSDAEK